jgi:hypothetical protein
VDEVEDRLEALEAQEGHDLVGVRPVASARLGLDAVPADGVAQARDAELAQELQVLPPADGVPARLDDVDVVGGQVGALEGTDDLQGRHRPLLPGGHRSLTRGAGK